VTTDFPIENLPFGVFTCGGGEPSVGVAIGDRILDLRRAHGAGLVDSPAALAASLNPLMAAGREHWSALRERAREVLTSPGLRSLVEPCLVPMSDAVMLPPAVIGDYTDFYASIHHATSVGRLFRPDNPLLPNYKHVPIGYHGRASSIVMSGAPVRRPHGQTPQFGPSAALDYELEVGFFVAQGNPLGEPIPIARARSHIFGLCLVNDWSARDIQAWEYQPLGPFLAKSFATSISPWVVTLEALEPFRAPAYPRPEGDPAPLPYLSAPEEAERGGLDVRLEAWLSSAKMRAEGAGPLLLGRSNLRDLYWTLGQLVAHHASNGCNLRTGDLLASGTVSGPEPEARGCMLELTRRGAEPLRLPTGELRAFLEDGDEVILRGYCERPGFPRIGFGECRGTVLPA
jgi:fumarylacetoacetase